MQDVVSLCKSNGIGAMRIYYPDHAILQALQGSGIRLILGVPNDNILSIGSNPSEATRWVQANVIPYASSIKYIAVGNEVSMDSPQAALVGPAMQNVLNSLNSANLGGKIKVTTAISTSLVINGYPPSDGTFTNMGFMGPVSNFLESNGSPLLLNVYTYFAYATSTMGNGNIDLNYALFTSPEPLFTDPNNGLRYQNLFDALVDATYAALYRVGAHHTRIWVSESGWPSKGGFGSLAHYNNGGDGATLHNAGTYYRNLIKHVKQGTPLRPGEAIETYLFELFDEDQKPGGVVEQHFGVFTPDQKLKYPGLFAPIQKPKYDVCFKRRH